MSVRSLPFALLAASHLAWLPAVLAQPVPLGPEFQVNTYTLSFQVNAAVASAGAGDFVVAWQSEGSAGSDTDNYSIQGQRFELPTTTSTTTSSTTTTSTLPTTELLPGRVVVIRPGTPAQPGTLARFVAKPVPCDAFTLPTANPVTTGGSLRVFDTSTTAGDDTFTLPSPGWKGLGSPAGVKGFKYTGAGSATDPCTVVVVKEKVVNGVCKSVLKAVCRSAGVTLTPPFTGAVGIILSLGTTDRYCASFGGDVVKNDATLTKRRKAPAPGACP